MTDMEVLCVDSPHKRYVNTDVPFVRSTRVLCSGCTDMGATLCLFKCCSRLVTGTLELVGVLQGAAECTHALTVINRGTYGRGQDCLEEHGATICQNGVTGCIPSALQGCMMLIARCLPHVCNDDGRAVQEHAVSSQAAQTQEWQSTSRSGFPAQVERVARFA